MEPNPGQKELIENTRGIYLVDAGAGTGKTFTLSRRYGTILTQENVSPSDILLITFTNNAAEEMKERVINSCDADPLDLQEAPISTFHSLCHRLLQKHGFDAPRLLGLDEHVTSTTTIVQNEVLEKKRFRSFLHGFIKNYPHYHNFLRVLNDKNSLLYVIHSLAAKGIIPLAGNEKYRWYQQGEDYLDGHFEYFLPVLEKANSPLPGKRGPKQSDYLNRVKSAFRNKCFYNDAPDLNDIIAEDSKQVKELVVGEAFNENRTELKQFIHELYSGYFRYCLEHNYLNFGFLQVLAYILLCEDSRVCEEMKHRFVMVDEFQDTSEIQFKLTLLLSETNNICAVGDWKQSIYSFQYASVDNIRKFSERIDRYKKELNVGQNRVSYPVNNVNTISLQENYRSGQPILDFSERSLFLEATVGETIDCDAIEGDLVHLESKRPELNIELKGLLSQEEPEAILYFIQRMIEQEYTVFEDNQQRPVEYRDVAVLTRTRSFGLELQDIARRHGIPLAYEGGVELFKTEPAILLLAWLRILDDPDSVAGWGVVLEETGYTLPETKKLLKETPPASRNYPLDMLDFKDELIAIKNSAPRIWSASVARLVFDRYGFCDGFTDKIIEVVQETVEASLMGLGELVAFIEDNIEAASTYEVDNALGEAVTVQTIHAAKGLEYPVVFVSDVNTRHFPGSGASTEVIEYREPVGLRQKKIFYDDDMPFAYDNWKTELVLRPLAGEYDEERRLMYVALTRAQQYLYLSADMDKASSFFENLRDHMDVEVINNPELKAVEEDSLGAKKLEVEAITRHAPLKIAVHDLMEEPVEAEEGMGAKYGQQVHEFAEKYALGEKIQPSNPDQEAISSWLDEIEGDLLVEKDCLLPLTVGDRVYTLAGIIDLMLIEPEQIRIVDYKTDRHKKNQPEYRKQLSVYYHVVKEIYSDRDVSIEIFYSAENELVELSPMSTDELKKLVKVQVE